MGNFHYAAVDFSDFSIDPAALGGCNHTHTVHGVFGAAQLEEWWWLGDGGQHILWRITGPDGVVAQGDEQTMREAFMAIICGEL